MKKILSLLLAAVMILSAAGCKNSENDDKVSSSKEEKKQEITEILETEDGKIRCVGIEKANSKLCDEENAYVVKFEFTNKKATPEQCQNQFVVSCFQNNVECDEIGSYSSTGGEQYKLLGNYFKETMNGGTITFGEAYVLSDKSPVTIIMKLNGGSSDKIGSVTLELPEEKEEISSDKVIADVQGTWVIGGKNRVKFTGNKISFDGVMNGTYVVDTEASNIDAELTATDGKLTIHLPYKYENGKLKVFNNNGDELVKE